jgi:hypothetical protein
VIDLDAAPEASGSRGSLLGVGVSPNSEILVSYFWRISRQFDEKMPRRSPDLGPAGWLEREPFCRVRRSGDEEDETEDRCGAEGEDRLGGAGRAVECCGPGQQYQVHPNQTCAWKKQTQEQAARVFDAGIGRDTEDIREREIDKLHTEIGQLTAERVLARRSGR